MILMILKITICYKQSSKMIMKRKNLLKNRINCHQFLNEKTKLIKVFQVLFLFKMILIHKRYMNFQKKWEKKYFQVRYIRGKLIPLPAESFGFASSRFTTRGCKHSLEFQKNVKYLKNKMMAQMIKYRALSL